MLTFEGLKFIIRRLMGLLFKEDYMRKNKKKLLSDEHDNAYNYVKNISLNGLRAITETPEPMYTLDSLNELPSPPTNLYIFYLNIVDKVNRRLFQVANEVVTEVKAGNVEALEFYLQDATRYGIRIDSTPTITNDALAEKDNSFTPNIINAYSSFLSDANKIHKLNCEVYLYRAGLIKPGTLTIF